MTIINSLPAYQSHNGESHAYKQLLSSCVHLEGGRDPIQSERERGSGCLVEGKGAREYIILTVLSTASRQEGMVGGGVGGGAAASCGVVGCGCHGLPVL